MVYAHMCFQVWVPFVPTEARECNGMSYSITLNSLKRFLIDPAASLGASKPSNSDTRGVTGLAFCVSAGIAIMEAMACLSKFPL